MNEKLELLKIRLLQLMDIGTEDAMFRRINGLDWNGYTMIGLRRLDNIEDCIMSVIRDKVPGCIVETGVWRGGACIFAAGVLREAGENRNVYLCDIFDGTFPVSDNPMDEWVTKHDFSQLSISQSEVEENFKHFDLFGENIMFKPGWFSDTLPTITEPVAILRLDGDTYKSTMDGLQLEKNMPSGGYIIMDDWGIDGSRKAFLDYFADQNSIPDVTLIDSSGAYLRKP